MNKFNLSGFALSLILSASALANETMTARLPYEPADSSRGVRVSYLNAGLDYEMRSGGKTYKGNIDSTQGVSLGYANLPASGLGWTANLAYLSMKDGSGSPLESARLDANLAYAMNSTFSIKGGLNYWKYITKTEFEPTPAIGVQAGIGIQFTRHFGVDVSYVVLRQEDYDMTLSGVEGALTATF